MYSAEQTENLDMKQSWFGFCSTNNTWMSHAHVHMRTDARVTVPISFLLPHVDHTRTQHSHTPTDHGRATNNMFVSPFSPITMDTPWTCGLAGWTYVWISLTGGVTNKQPLRWTHDRHRFTFYRTVRSDRFMPGITPSRTHPICTRECRCFRRPAQGARTANERIDISSSFSCR